MKNVPPDPRPRFVPIVASPAYTQARLHEMRQIASQADFARDRRAGQGPNPRMNTQKRLRPLTGSTRVHRSESSRVTANPNYIAGSGLSFI